jgi:hypothetical protein
VAKKLRQDLTSDPGLSPARQSELPPEMIWALKQWNLPLDRVHRLSDYKRVGLVKNPGHAARLRELGILKPGRWLGANYCFWYPAETAQMILSLSTQRPERHPGRRKAWEPPPASIAAPPGEGHGVDAPPVTSGMSAASEVTPTDRPARGPTAQHHDPGRAQRPSSPTSRSSTPPLLPAWPRPATDVPEDTDQVSRTRPTAKEHET